MNNRGNRQRDQQPRRHICASFLVAIVVTFGLATVAAADIDFTAPADLRPTLSTQAAIMVLSMFTCSVL